MATAASRALAVFVVAGLSLSGIAQASPATLETRDLTVVDATGRLSADRLKVLADHAQATLERILDFWSADPGLDRYGKIRVVFHAPHRDIYDSIFVWEKTDGERRRVVRVYGFEGSPQMMTHKLTSAVFPQKDKLIRNVMGLISETQFGNPLSFPMCGLGADDWVSAHQAAKSYIPLNELGPDHESWGMKPIGGGKLSIVDKAKQHKAYAEAGSFGNYLFRAHGISKIRQFNRISHEKARPSQDVFGATMQELEASWIAALRATEEARKQDVAIAAKLIRDNPVKACAEAQKVVTSKR